MIVDPGLVKKIAALSMLELTEKEIGEYTPQLKEILEYFKKIDSADAEMFEALLHPVKIQGKMRPDEPKEGITQDSALSGKEQVKGYFKGPKVV